MEDVWVCWDVSRGSVLILVNYDEDETIYVLDFSMSQWSVHVCREERTSKENSEISS